jgi:hypothetical protein
MESGCAALQAALILEFIRPFSLRIDHAGDDKDDRV